MKCPTLDKLSQYVDDLVTEQEHDELHSHVKNCDECQRVVEAFRGEQRFIKETFQTPVLPDDFASLFLISLSLMNRRLSAQKGLLGNVSCFQQRELC